MKRKALVFVSVIGLAGVVIIFSLVMVTVAYNRYRYIMRYSNFLQGYTLANAGLGRLKYKIGQSDFTNETFIFPSTSTNSVTITIDQPNNAAVIAVTEPAGGATLDVTYRGKLLTSYTLLKNN